MNLVPARHFVEQGARPGRAYACDHVRGLDPRDPTSTLGSRRSHSFRMATSGKPSNWLPLGLLVEQERLPRKAGAPSAILEILENFEISTKNVNFWKPLNPIEILYSIIISLFC